MEKDSNKLWNCLCCCGDDHTVRQGGRHINLVQLRKLASGHLAVVNVMLSIYERYPLACAIVCDRCLKEKREIKYAMAGRQGQDGHAEYYRVPFSELEDTPVYWPDLHLDLGPIFRN